MVYLGLGKIQPIPARFTLDRAHPPWICTVGTASPNLFYQQLQRYVDSKVKVGKKNKDKEKQKKTFETEYWPLISKLYSFEVHVRQTLTGTYPSQRL
jgi:hypothetical protein